ncbi:MAG: nucleotidyltransferase family protein [Candidatus Hodarchaeota archaeon]
MRLSPELQFISNTLTASLKDDHSLIEVSAQAVLDHINWNECIQLVIHHGLGGLLFYWLRKLRFKSSVPHDVYRSLRGIYESYSNIEEGHREIIKKILTGFHESGIEVILLKGAQLGHIDYPHFSLRPMEDIDLLVERSNQSRIIKIMLEMGFNLYKTGDSCNKFFIRRIQKRRTKKIHNPIFIEIHSNLETSIRLNRALSVDMDEFWSGTQMESIWNGTQMGSIAGFPFFQLCPTYNLMYLCSHFGEHHFSRLIWAYDIALLIHRHGEEILWGKLEDLCGRMKIRSPLYYSLSLCQELFQVPIPEKVLKNLSPFWWRRKIGHFLIRRNLLSPQKSQMSRFTQFLIRALCIDSWMEAMLWFLFPTREWMKKQYSLQGTREIYPYYLLHPILYLINTIRAPLR